MKVYNTHLQRFTNDNSPWPSKILIILKRGKLNDNFTFPLRLYWEMPYLNLHKNGYYLHKFAVQNIHKDNNIQCLIPRKLFTLCK